MAQTPTPQYNRTSYTDFSGGLSTRQNSLKLGKNKFTQLDNCVLADNDTIRKAPGYAVDGSPWSSSTATSFIRMLVNYRVGSSVDSLVVAAQDDANTNAAFKVDLKQTFGDGNYSYIGHTTGTALFTNGSKIVTGTSTVWNVNLKAGDWIKPNTNSTWYLIDSVDSATQVTLHINYAETTTLSVAYMARIVLNYQAIPNAVTFNNSLVIVNGADRPMRFDNATLALLQDADAPIAQFVEVHKNRVFMATASALFWSAANDEITWSVLSTSPIYPEDNGNIVGIRSFANSMMVLKDNGHVYQVYGEFDQSAAGAPALIRRIDTADNIGVISGRSAVVNDDNLMYFLAETGVYVVTPQMTVQKISWDISPTVQNLVFTGGGTSSAKTFSWSQNSQWATGTILATQSVRPNNGIAPYFDNLSIAGAFQGRNAVACVTDTNHDVHIAWITADQSLVKYTHWLASDNTSSTQTVYDVTTPLTYQDGAPNTPTTIIQGKASAACIAVAPNGKIGVGMIVTSPAATSGTNEYGVVFGELSGGVWTNAGISTAFPPNSPASSVSCSTTYTSSSVPYMVATVNSNFGKGTSFFARPIATWTSLVLLNGEFDSEDFFIDGSGNIHLVSANLNRIYYLYSTNNGVTWSYPLTSSSLGTQYLTADITVTGDPNRIHVRMDDTSNVLLTYLYTSGTGNDLNKTIRYNLTPFTPAKSTIDTGVYGLLGYLNDGAGAETFYEFSSTQEKIIYDTIYSTGTATLTNGNAAVVGQGTKWTTWVQAGDKIKASGDDASVYGTVLSVNSDTSITLTAVYAGTSVVAQAYKSRRRSSVLSASPSIDSSYYYGSASMSVSGGVNAVSGFGLSSGVIYARRISLYAKWTSPVMADTALTSWGNLVVTGEVAGGNTIVYEIGLSTTGTILVVNTNPASNNTLISTSTTLNHAQFIVTFVFAAFAQASILSAALNYTAPGVSSGGGQAATGFVFNNEIYLAVTETGNTRNNTALFLDWKHAWGNYTVPVFCFARMKQTLYAGSSTGGSVYRLRTGYDFGGSAYTMTAITREDILGDIELDKDVYKAYVLYKVQNSGTFTFSYSLDNYIRGSASWNDTSVNQTSSSNTPGMQEIPIGSKCSTIQFKVSQPDSNVRVEIVAVTLLYSYLNLR